MTSSNPEDHMITWNEADSAGKAKAFEQFSDTLEAYEA